MTGLSEAAAVMPAVWHPWRTLRHRPEITVRWERMPGRMGEWCQRTKTITLHPDQLQRERRTTATHETIHAERGHDGPCTGAVELSVKKEAARRLIGIYALAEAVLFYGQEDLPALAEELWTDEEHVAIRLQWLHPAERGYLEQRLAARDGAA